MLDPPRNPRTRSQAKWTWRESFGPPAGGAVRVRPHASVVNPPFSPFRSLRVEFLARDGPKAAWFNARIDISEEQFRRGVPDPDTLQPL